MEQSNDERIEIIKQAVDHIQNRKSLEELDFERELSKIDGHIAGWGDE